MAPKVAKADGAGEADKDDADDAEGNAGKKDGGRGSIGLFTASAKHRMHASPDTRT